MEASKLSCSHGAAAPRVPDAVVILNGETITFAGTSAQAPAATAAQVTTVQTVTPGCETATRTSSASAPST